MKLLLLCVGLLISFSTMADEKIIPPQEETIDLMEVNYKYQLDLLKYQDNLLKALLKIPFEKRVYIYPALFESHNVPKKIVTHPQIIIWKGKKPTKIAPQLQKYAEKYLDYMPARLYPVLDPDGWPKQTKEDDWHNVSKLIPDVITTPNEISTPALLNETN